ncbi:hypothetical protein Blue_155 [Bacillus phage Deep Blue]|uniref:Uncharacterized protein n=1 Tax=Bacillus phage Deep Blue TaxID=1792245 RepID=A0A140HLW6_9CAUD|nr:hypothetical protein Blue_155 [Bacillus phage Deep Blue]AMO25978.1 hypothetical protein Blue_155 [Bacillus phage Deep Blue]
MKDSTEKWDRISVTQEEVEQLFKWRDKNKDLVRNFSPVLERGVIINQATSAIKYVFQKEGDNYLYDVVQNKTGEVVHTTIWNTVSGEGKILRTVLDHKDLQGYNEVLISLHASLMAYMEHYQDNEEYVRKQTNTVVIGHKKQKKSKKKVPVKIRRKVYTLKVTEESLNEVTRSYERQTDKWTVRGHWRTTKNGQVWIKPHIKGDGKEVTPKEYKM